MSVILNIDTSTENATVCISKNEKVIQFVTNNKQKDHASFLQPAIKKLLKQNNISIHELNAVAVTEGPGSYTGLRVGMASAKGLCYALQVPLITLGTLEVMALSIMEKTNKPESYLYCPMIDARRMEVFTALFDHLLNEILPPHALVLEPTSFDNIMQEKPIIFSGSGSKKFVNLLSIRHNLLVNNSAISASALTKISLQKFHQKGFADLSNVEPAYIKQNLYSFK
jgi:tRNA threonylcarbamoyladenosine biosynthesis protein TsaB